MTDLSVNLNFDAYTSQALHEERMLAKGVDRYNDNEQFAHRMGDLSRAESRLFAQAFGKVEAAIKAAHAAELEKRQRGRVFKVLDNLDATTLTAIILKNAINVATSEESLTGLYEALGYDVRVAIATERLRNEDKKAHKKLMDPRMNRTERSRRVAAEDLLNRFPEPGEDPVVSAEIGADLFSIAEESSGLFNHFEKEIEDEPGRFQMHLTFTEEALEQVDKVRDREQWMRPVYQSMLTKPNPWTDFDTGAFNDQRVSKTVKLVNTFNSKSKNLIAAAVERGEPFVKALNGIQDVALRINRPVLEALEFCHTMRVKVGKLSGPLKVIPKTADDKTKWSARKDNKVINAKYAVVARDLEEAKLLVDKERFFQPHVLDWRGRVYAKPGFNHQRADYCKGMFELADGEVLTERGVYWVKWNIATTAGVKTDKGYKTDKAPADERVQWADDRLEMILAIARDPIAHVDLWKDMDSPFCFLASCIALENHLEDPEGYVCHLPVAIDGSCSGLQHFSAMVRDADGGALVNLVPSELPQDVYAAVSKITKAMVEADLVSDDEETRRFAKLWNDFGIDRKLTKRNVMTFGYGSVESGFADQLFEDIVDLDEETRAHFGHTGKDTWVAMMALCRYLAKHNMTGIKQTVKGAPVVMEFLQKIAGIMASVNLPVYWTTPMGFPALNAYYKIETARIRTVLWNKGVSVPYMPVVQTGYTKELNAHKQRNSISPNFIHSFDAAHLQSVVINCMNVGINAFLLIHDSFAALPNRMDEFSRIVRQSLVDLYETRDPLEDLYYGARAALVVEQEARAGDEEAVNKITKKIAELDKLEIPVKGKLNLEGILDSQYAFA